MAGRYIPVRQHLHRHNKIPAPLQHIKVQHDRKIQGPPGIVEQQTRIHNLLIQDQIRPPHLLMEQDPLEVRVEPGQAVVEVQAEAAVVAEEDANSNLFFI
jgi:hypothetical protein